MLPPSTLVLLALDAFFLEHRLCGDLDSWVEALYSGDFVRVTRRESAVVVGSAGAPRSVKLKQDVQAIGPDVENKGVKNRNPVGDRVSAPREIHEDDRKSDTGLTQFRTVEDGWCVGTRWKKWWAGTGLNRRHQDFQSCALPTELPARQAA